MLGRASRFSLLKGDVTAGLFADCRNEGASTGKVTSYEIMQQLVNIRDHSWMHVLRCEYNVA